MTYQILARKYRPREFHEVIGQNHILKVLMYSFKFNKIHHAYLLSGMHGVGKTTIARLISKGLNCETGINFNSCEKCTNCNEINNGCFIDLIEVDAASKTKIEDIKELIEYIYYMPTKGRFKIYLIDEVHMLSKYSFNALLKIMEEPPQHIKFLLATTNPQKLPLTITSRCIQFYLKSINVEQIYAKIIFLLNQEKISFEENALQLIAEYSKGSMRDALSITDHAIAMGNGNITTKVINKIFGFINIEYPLIIIELLADANCKDIFLNLSNYINDGINIENLLTEMISLLHDIIMIQFSLNDKFLKNKKNEKILCRLKKLATIISPTDIQLYYQIFIKGYKDLIYVPNKKIGIEVILLRALGLHPTINLIKNTSFLK